MLFLSWLLPAVLGLVASADAVAADTSHSQLVKLAATSPNGVIQLDSRTFDLVTSARRNWSATIHLTAMDPRRRCGPCKEFDPSFNAVAKSWSTVPAATRDTHFFATLDFDNGQMVFQSLGLQSAPVVYVYPAAEGEHKADNLKSPFIKYDFSNGFDAGPLAESLSRHTLVPIPYRDPIDWSKWFTVLGALVPLGLLARYVGPAFASRWTWAFITLTTSLIMTSGFMFVRIRGMPRTAPGGDWIAGGYQNQYGQETQVVAGLYGLLGASFLMLTLVAPAQTSRYRQKLQIWAFTAVIFIVFSILISLFRVKSRQYPFRLLI